MHLQPCFNKVAGNPRLWVASTEVKERYRMRVLPVLFALALVSCDRLAADLIVSETFDSTLNGWSLVQQPPTFAGSAAWSSVDSGGLSTSGSLALTGSGSSAVAAEKCFPLTGPRVNWTASAKVLVPNVVSPIEVGFDLYFFQSTDCSGTGADTEDTIFFPLSSGVWGVSVDAESTPTFGDVSNEHSVEVVLQNRR
jgi:hypothetical protein